MAFNKRGKAILLTVILLIVIALSAIYYYKWKHPAIETVQFIPEKCDVLIAINSHALIEGFFSNRDLFKNDTGKMSRIQKEAGIDLVRPFLIAASTKLKYVCIIFSVNDTVKLKKFIGSISAEDKKTVSILVKQNRCFVFLGKKQLLENAQNNAFIKRNITYMENPFTKEWVKGCIESFAHIPALAGIRNSNDILFHTEMQETDSISTFKIILKNLDLTKPQSLESKEGIAIQLPYNLWNQNAILKDKIRKVALSARIDTSGFFQTNGPLSLQYIGITKMPKSKITYEYDDEFNRVKKIKTEWVEAPNILINIPAMGGLWWTKTKADSTYEPTKIKVIQLFGYRFFIKQNNNNAIFYTTVNPSKVENSKFHNCFLYCNANDVKAKKLLEKINVPFSLPITLKELSVFPEGNQLTFRVDFNPKEKSVFRNIVSMINFYQKKPTNAR